MNSPINKIRVGAVSITIWENEKTGKDGQKYTAQSFQLDKNYKTGDDWKTTNSYSANDLMLVIMACQKALEYKYLKNEPKTESPI